MKATWTGPRYYFPGLGFVEPGDTLNVPASIADEDPRWAKSSTGKKGKASAADKPADEPQED